MPRPLQTVKMDERLVLLANSVSDAVHVALLQGVQADLAAGVVAQVAADYIRATYGNRALKGLALAVRERARMPMPTDISAAEGGEVTGKARGRLN